jgi:hypothetical protein
MSAHVFSLRRTLATVALLVTVTGIATTPAGAGPIGPNQHFSGSVNGKRASAVVTTVCPGPSAGRTGPVAGGQTLAVARGRGRDGYTGPFTAIYAWFVPPSGTTTAPTQLKFEAYRTPQAIPTSVQVPCDGTGEVEFSSCPYLAPCAFGWTPDFVDVRFVDVAV